MAHVALNVVLGLVLLLIGVRLGRWMTSLEHRLLLRAHVDSILAEFLRNATYAVFLVLLLVSALDLSGFPTATLLTAVGAAGQAIGLALKDSLGHIAAGVMLIALRPFRAGDTVKIAGQEGVVDGVFIFQTRIHTADNRDIVLMNGSVVGAPIINYSRRDTRRADIILRLGADSDLAMAMRAAKEAVEADRRVQADPAPAVTIAEITENGAALSVLAWCKADDLGSVRSDLLVSLQAALLNHGVALVQAPNTRGGKSATAV